MSGIYVFSLKAGCVKFGSCNARKRMIYTVKSFSIHLKILRRPGGKTSVGLWITKHLALNHFSWLGSTMLFHLFQWRL